MPSAAQASPTCAAMAPNHARSWLAAEADSATMDISRIDYALRLFGLPFTWRTRITQWKPGESFVDEQESGPYALWRHTHRFESLLDKRGRMRFTDLTVQGFAASEVGVPWDDLMATLHGRLPDGRIVKGVEVFRRRQHRRAGARSQLRRSEADGQPDHDVVEPCKAVDLVVVGAALDGAVTDPQL